MVLEDIKKCMRSRALNSEKRKDDELSCEDLEMIMWLWANVIEIT